MKKFTSDEIRDFVSRPSFDEQVILEKDPSWPKVSIVTPSYNQGRFLERTILSVLNQNYPNLEYIIMDGGSTDGSIEIIRKYEKYLAHWVSEKDGGQAHAIVKGFGRCTGKILAYLNSDDTYVSEALLEVSRAFMRHPTCDLVFGDTNFIDAADNMIGECRFTRFDFATLIYEGSSLHQPSAFWASDTYRVVGGLNPKYDFCMDYDFFCRIGEKGELRHIRKPLANFRLHEDAKSSTIMRIGKAEHEEIARRYLRHHSRIYVRYKRSLCQIRRLVCYIAQGDADYAVRGICKRLCRAVGRAPGTGAQ